MTIHSKFLEGQQAPPYSMFSKENTDWYNEMARRSFEGFEYKGTRISGDHFFFLNFYQIMVSIMDSGGTPTSKFRFDYPFYSKEDDYHFKQFEEAEQMGKVVFFFTGRGYGKTYMISSIPVKLYTFLPRSKSLITASGADHADETMSKIIDSLNGLDQKHPTIRHKRLTDTPDFIEAGEEVYTPDGFKDTVGYLSTIEKIIYDKKPGKTKGRRVDFQLFEEVGDWGGAASLKECVAASEGTWKVGKIIRARVFMIGTGGTVKSAEARSICFNPEAYNLYTVREWDDKPSGIIVPAFKKLGGFWEKNGISDEESARKYLESIRLKKKSDPIAYSKFKQEYPFDHIEMFAQKGGNNFDQELLSEQYTRLVNNIDFRKGTWGDLFWKRNKGKKVGVEWKESNSGKIWILEHPNKMEDGNVYPYLYIGGYDGIDIGTEDSVTGQGSKGALSIKKRMLNSLTTNNLYVCHYEDRPKDIDEFFENCLKLSWYFNMMINIEDSKRGIVGYFKTENEFPRFMKRPRLTLTDPTIEVNETKLIGVTPTSKNMEYGETFLARYIKEYFQQIYHLPVLEALRDFTMEDRGRFDLVISMFMAELGDDELMDKQIVPVKPNYTMENYGYYTDAGGIKRWGKVPQKNNKKLQEQFHFSQESFQNTSRTNYTLNN